MPKSDPLRIIIIDFDASAFFNPKKPKQTPSIGTPFTGAPELFDRTLYSEVDHTKSDSWSIGASLFIFIYGRMAYGADYNEGKRKFWPNNRFSGFMSGVLRTKMTLNKEFPFPNVSTLHAVTEYPEEWGVTNMIAVMKRLMLVLPYDRPSPLAMGIEMGLLSKPPA